MNQKTKTQSSKLSIIKNLNSNTYGIPLPKKKKLSAKDVLRLHSALIRSFINGNIEESSAKTLSYLLSNFLASYQAFEMEQRLIKLEEKAQS